VSTCPQNEVTGGPKSGDDCVRAGKQPSDDSPQGMGVWGVVLYRFFTSRVIYMSSFLILLFSSHFYPCFFFFLFLFEILCETKLSLVIIVCTQSLSVLLILVGLLPVVFSPHRSSSVYLRSSSPSSLLHLFIVFLRLLLLRFSFSVFCLPQSSSVSVGE
jgi:hypothetical protein